MLQSKGLMQIHLQRDRDSVSPIIGRDCVFIDSIGKSSPAVPYQCQRLTSNASHNSTFVIYPISCTHFRSDTLPHRGPAVRLQTLQNINI